MPRTEDSPVSSFTFSMMLNGIARNLCPECMAGNVFSGIYSMNTRCPKCGMLFEKEPGYFLGALVFAYLIGAFSLIPTLIVALFILHWEIADAIGLGIVQLLILHPFLFHYSKLVWLFVETRMTRSLD